jgi:hypothetical protein
MHQDRGFKFYKAHSTLRTVQVDTSTKYSPSSGVQYEARNLGKALRWAHHYPGKKRNRVVPEYLSYRGAIAYGTDNVVIILWLILDLCFLATFLSADASVPRRRNLIALGRSKNRSLPSLVNGHRTLIFRICCYRALGPSEDEVSRVFPRKKYGLRSVFPFWLPPEASPPWYFVIY